VVFWDAADVIGIEECRDMPPEAVIEIEQVLDQWLGAIGTIVFDIEDRTAAVEDADAALQHFKFKAFHVDLDQTDFPIWHQVVEFDALDC
jgi:hypothetical protein